MALASATAMNQALDALTGGALNLLGFISLHTATPGTTGASEATGGGYARQACSWNAAAASSKTNSSALTFATTALAPITHVGGWSAVTAGTYGIGAALSSPVTAPTITIAPGAITFTGSLGARDGHACATTESAPR